MLKPICIDKIEDSCAGKTERTCIKYGVGDFYYEGVETGGQITDNRVQMTDNRAKSRAVVFVNSLRKKILAFLGPPP